MNTKSYLSKLLLVTALSSSCVPLIHANTVYAYEDNTPLASESISGSYLTGYLDDSNEIQFYSHEGLEREPFSTIVVFVKGVVVGYLVATVIDGIVIAATGKSGAEWVATAIKSVVGTRYTRNVYLPANGPYTCPGVVIDHSGMCP